MRKTTWVAAGAALGVIAWACDTITLPPEVNSPVNQCTDSPTCMSVFPEAGAAEAGTAPTCVNGTCVAETGLRPILVVSSPTVAVIAPGITFGLPQKAPTTSPPCRAADGGASLLPCIWLPPLGLISGGIYVSPQLAVLLAPPGGLRPNVPSSPLEDQQTSLPVTVTFHPLWGGPLLADQLGLPLTTLTTTSKPSTQNFHPGPTNGTSDALPQVYSANVPIGFSANDSLGQYVVEIAPIDPYTMFPPFVGQFTLPRNNLSVPYVAPSDIFQGVALIATTYTVQAAAGAPNLAGWTVYAVDSHGFRITGKVTLAGVPNEQVTLYDATQTTDQSKEKLFVEPPAGVHLPKYFNNEAFKLLNRTIAYPGLPEQVSVSGTVVLESDPSRLIAARIVFVADGGADGAAVATTDIITPFSNQLYYRAETTTNGLGQYQVTLPPGKYRTYIIPSDGDLALTVPSSLLTIAGPPAPLIQPGKGLTITARVHLRGQALLGDGTPLYGAQVVVDPSADAPLDPKSFDPLALPRETRAATTADGQFDVLVDPGTVDISVRPADGSRYPWVVTTNWKVLADTKLPKPIVIPPPGDPSKPTTRSGGQLADAVGHPLTRTVVRAYGFPPLGPTADGGTPSSRGARLLGMTISDDQGVFELYLAPPDP